MSCHGKIFIRAKHLKISNLLYSPIFNWILVLWGLHLFVLNVLFFIIQVLDITLVNNEMLTWILYSFLNWNINIIMDHCSNRFLSCFFFLVLIKILRKTDLIFGTHLLGEDNLLRWTTITVGGKQPKFKFWIRWFVFHLVLMLLKTT